MTAMVVSSGAEQAKQLDGSEWMPSLGLTQEDLDQLAVEEDSSPLDNEGSPQDLFVLAKKRTHSAQQAYGCPNGRLRLRVRVTTDTSMNEAQKTPFAATLGSKSVIRIRRPFALRKNGTARNSLVDIATPSRGLSQETLDLLCEGKSPEVNKDQSSPLDTELLNVKRRQAMQRSSTPLETDQATKVLEAVYQAVEAENQALKARNLSEVVDFAPLARAHGEEGTPFSQEELDKLCVVSKSEQFEESEEGTPPLLVEAKEKQSPSIGAGSKQSSKKQRRPRSPASPPRGGA